jgi:hypothetical protein
LTKKIKPCVGEKIRTPERRPRIARVTPAQAPILPPARACVRRHGRPEVLVEIIVTAAK